MYSQNTANAKKFCFAQGNSRPEKTEGAVMLIPSSWPLFVIAHQLLIPDVGDVVPVNLFQLNGVYSHLSPLSCLAVGSLGSGNVLQSHRVTEALWKKESKISCWARKCSC